MASVTAWVLLPILWIVVAIGWAPMLLSKRLRDLCGRWPTDRVVLNYPLFVTIVVGTHAVTFLAVGVQLPSGGPYLLWAFASTLLVAGVSWLVVAVVLPTTRKIHLSGWAIASRRGCGLVRCTGQCRVRGAGFGVIRPGLPRVSGVSRAAMVGHIGHSPAATIRFVRDTRPDFIETVDTQHSLVVAVMLPTPPTRTRARGQVIIPE